MTHSPGPVPLHSRIAAEIVRRAIAPGQDPDHPLPSEQEVQRDCGVSHAVARQALAELREAGVIVTVPRRGNFLARPIPGPRTS